MDLREMLDGLSRTVAVDLRSGEEQDVHFKVRFDRGKGNVARAYQYDSDIRELSKVGIAALPDGNGDEVNRCGDGMIAKWEESGKLDLPGDIRWQHDAESSQEMVEFFATACLYPPIVNRPYCHKWQTIPSAEQLNVTPQSWLAGIGDTPGEVGKLLDDYLCREDVSRADRIACRKRFIETMREVYDFLDQFESCVPMIINNSRRMGYGNTFRGLLGRVRGAIRHQQECLIRLLDDQTK